MVVLPAKSDMLFKFCCSICTSMKKKGGRHKRQLNVESRVVFIQSKILTHKRSKKQACSAEKTSPHRHNGSASGWIGRLVFIPEEGAHALQTCRQLCPTSRLVVTSHLLGMCVPWIRKHRELPVPSRPTFQSIQMLIGCVDED